MSIGELLLAVLVASFVLAPSLLIALSTKGTTKERVVWSLAAFVSIPLVLAAWMVHIYVFEPAGGIHPNYGGLLAIFIAAAPWLVYAGFTRRKA